jgi:predicted small secreted protein
LCTAAVRVEEGTDIGAHFYADAEAGRVVEVQLGLRVSDLY